MKEFGAWDSGLIFLLLLIFLPRGVTGPNLRGTTISTYPVCTNTPT